MYKKISLMVLVFLVYSVSVPAQTDKASGANHPMMMNHKAIDKRISLNLSPNMKVHQLENMRSHVEAIQAIIGLIAEKKFTKAAELSHVKLGLTEEMKKMCSMFQNEKFRTLGFQFHKSADKLAEVLTSKDTEKSLHALHNTMGYCVQCHATFRQ